MYEGNEWPEYPVFGPSDPSPKAFTDPQKTGSKTTNFLLHSYVAV